MTALLVVASIYGTLFALACLAYAADAIWNKPPEIKMARSLLRRYTYTPRRRK